MSTRWTAEMGAKWTCAGSRPAASSSPSPRRWLRLHDQGAIPSGNGPEEFGTFMRSELEKWGEVIRRNNIQPD